MNETKSTVETTEINVRLDSAFNLKSIPDTL